MTKFVLTEKEGVQFYTVPAFSKTGLVKHGFSTRIGGVSKEPYQSLNLGFHTGDDWVQVKENRRLFTESVGISLKNVVAAHQVHGENIFTADIDDRGKGAFEQDSAIKETDAFITNEPDVALIAFFADCVPVMFLDPVEKVIALVHAGWKGTVLEIGKKTVQKMHQDFSCQPENILAAIGPSIGPCHYEVDAPVINQFKEKFSQWEKILTLKNNGKAQLNLWEANRLQLLDSGVRKDNITVSELCTYCHPEALYSYRFGNGRTGRLAGIIMLSQ